MFGISKFKHSRAFILRMNLNFYFHQICVYTTNRINLVKKMKSPEHIRYNSYKSTWMRMNVEFC